MGLNLISGQRLTYEKKARYDLGGVTNNEA